MLMVVAWVSRWLGFVGLYLWLWVGVAVVVGCGDGVVVGFGMILGSAFCYWMDFVVLMWWVWFWMLCGGLGVPGGSGGLWG